MLKVKWDLGLIGGVLFVNLVFEIVEIFVEEMEIYIMWVLVDMVVFGLSGKDIMLYLLGCIVEFIGGCSLEMNIVLVCYNVVVVV